MRLLMRLCAKSTFPYDLGYHHNLQGFIYRLIRRAGYDDLHDRKGCKFFSFSNVIPPTRTVEKDSIRSIVVASPNEDLIRTMQGKLEETWGSDIKLGNMSFRLEGSRLFDIELPESFHDCELIAGTPIVVRIPKYQLSKYEIDPARDYDYVYWRKGHTPTAFVNQLEENIVKKYKEYSSVEVKTLQIFEKLRFKKQVAVPLKMKGKETTVIGTLWEFHFQALNGSKREILQFGLDAGFGEMNSLGFGFMNLVGDVDQYK